MTSSKTLIRERSRKRAIREQPRILMLEILPKNAVVAEIGVWRGTFSTKILRICDPKELHLVDPWSYQPEFSATIYGTNPPDQIEEIYGRVCEKFADDGRIHIHRATSDEAFARFADDYFDWIYIDGNHHAPYIDRDLENALRTVKPNGIITGDDYFWGKKSGDMSIKRAVDALVDKLGPKAEFGLIGNQYIIRPNQGN